MTVSELIMWLQEQDQNALVNTETGLIRTVCLSQQAIKVKNAKMVFLGD